MDDLIEFFCGSYNYFGIVNKIKFFFYETS